MNIHPLEEDQSQAMLALEPILGPLDDALRHGFALYQGGDYSDAARAEHSTRTVRNIVYDHAETRMLEYAESIDGLIALNIRGMRVFNYQDKVVVRMKKVNSKGKHANYPTAQQLDYDYQLRFPDLPPPARRLVAGYEPDPSDTYVERFMIARPIAKTVYWSAQVNLHEGEASWENITPADVFGKDFSHLTQEVLENMRRRHG